jgi:hypothetical protein
VNVIMGLWLEMIDLLLEILRSRRLESVNQRSDIQHSVVAHHFHKHLLVRPPDSSPCILLQKYCLLLLLLFRLTLLLVPLLLRYIWSSCFCQVVSVLCLCGLSKIRRLFKSDIYSIRTKSRQNNWSVTVCNLTLEHTFVIQKSVVCHK